MTIKSYNSIDDLFSDLENDVINIVKNEISDKVIKMAQDSVQENVLDVYEPATYKRRSGHNSGGLKDTWFSDTDIENDKITLTIQNDAKPVGDDLDDLAESIEYGYGKKDEIWNKPRPFISKVQEELENSEIIEDTLLDELKNKGW